MSWTHYIPEVMILNQFDFRSNKIIYNANIYTTAMGQ